MIKLILLIFVTYFLFSQDIHPELAPFKDFIGKTWKGEFPSKPNESKKTDIQHWELILNGKAIRILHSINDGEYGGESILYYNSKKRKIEFYYFTTADFYTNGVIEIKDNIYTSHEYVVGNEDGITEVKSIVTLTKNNELHVKSIFKKNNKWNYEDGGIIVYVFAPNSKVIFK